MALRRVIAHQKRKEQEARAALQPQRDLIQKLRRAVKHLKEEREALRVALARTGAREEIFRIQRVLEQSEDRQRRERMDALVRKLS
ncbi:MAG: hypothetical protein F4205_18175 [Gemmatimonadetes bacterium]|nr:hypothetical protein [Chloroflexota bacterium]MYG37401.1 hypothetical protein [Gemmatimonadota bacterium]